MWARLHDDGTIEMFHTPRGVDTETVHHSRLIFEVWPQEDLKRILNIVPASYADQPPSARHVAIDEHPTSHADHVTVTRTWEDRTPRVEEPSQGVSIVDNSTVINQMASLELPLMQREADTLLRAHAANAGTVFSASDYILLATLIGRAVPRTGSDTVDLKAAAVHVHHEMRRTSEALAQAIVQRQEAAS
jgi:hypothetical protein